MRKKNYFYCKRIKFIDFSRGVFRICGLFLAVARRLLKIHAARKTRSRFATRQAQPGLATDTAFDGRPHRECTINVCARLCACVRACVLHTVHICVALFPPSLPHTIPLRPSRPPFSSRFFPASSRGRSCGSLAERMALFFYHTLTWVNSARSAE